MIWFLREVFRVLEDVQRRVVRMEGALARLERGGVLMAATLDDLKAQVDANTTLEGSAVTLIQGIAAQLQAALAANDPAKVQALVNELQASAAPLAAAITANTPAAPTP